MKNIIVEVRGGRVVEIYSEDRQSVITVVDWDETGPRNFAAPDAYHFPTVAFSRLPAETLAAYDQASEERSNVCPLIISTN
jgi:hypothetical protein